MGKADRLSRRPDWKVKVKKKTMRKLDIVGLSMNTWKTGWTEHMDPER